MFTLSVEVPLGTSGTITLPRLPSSSESSSTELQGDNVQMDGSAVNATRNSRGNLVLEATGGNHTIVLS